MTSIKEEGANPRLELLLQRSSVYFRRCISLSVFYLVNNTVEEWVPHRNKEIMALIGMYFTQPIFVSDHVDISLLTCDSYRFVGGVLQPTWIAWLPDIFKMNDSWIVKWTFDFWSQFGEVGCSIVSVADLRIMHQNKQASQDKWLRWKTQYMSKLKSNVIWRINCGALGMEVYNGSEVSSMEQIREKYAPRIRMWSTKQDGYQFECFIDDLLFQWCAPSDFCIVLWARNCPFAPGKLEIDRRNLRSKLVGCGEECSEGPLTPLKRSFKKNSSLQAPPRKRRRKKR